MVESKSRDAFALDIKLFLTIQDNDVTSLSQGLWRPVKNKVTLIRKAKRVTESVGEFSQQICAIEITASVEMFHLLTCFNDLEFPLLETISLAIAVKNRQAFGPGAPLTLLKVPKLHVQVVEAGDAFRPVLEDFHAPLAQLTSLSLDLRKMTGRHESPPTLLNGFVELLFKCQNLITLEVLIGTGHAVLDSCSISPHWYISPICAHYNSPIMLLPRQLVTVTVFYYNNIF
ncbi:hypothetical protein BDP27DRAFT_1428053 [Rhodocollybia butyracea]|uniref:Uncharacterized protein n=1 Tax=Rhodocollybia butyracea TaxID=206335 RepID=A0A9P5PFH3_9AGAR|nr:hypothetical protein BDP27DRAFT_1428053 [Rhodocollybia butyracea]